MTDPHEVPELPGWIFIRGSEHPTAAEVERYEPGRLRLARYVANDGDWPDGQLAVMRLFLGDLGPDGPTSSERWKAWIICVRCLDEDGEPMTREPNGWIITQLETFDTWRRGRDPKHLQKWATEVREKRERHQKRLSAEKNADHIALMARKIRRDMGLKSKAFVPDKDSGLWTPGD